MKVSILLADKGTANPQSGTLNLLNIGWTHTALRPIPIPTAPGLQPTVQLMTPAHAIAVFLEVDHQHCNRPLQLVLSLVTEDGESVSVSGPAGPQPMRLTQSIVVPSPPRVPIGSPGTASTLIEIVPGLPLQPGTYNWRVEIDGETDENWRARFYVLPSPQQPTMTFS